MSCMNVHFTFILYLLPTFAIINYIINNNMNRYLDAPPAASTSAVSSNNSKDNKEIDALHTNNYKDNYNGNDNDNDYDLDDYEESHGKERYQLLPPYDDNNSNSGTTGSSNSKKSVLQQRFHRMSAALCEVVDDYGLVSFHPLNIEDVEVSYATVYFDSYHSTT